jgi:tryptophan 2,3-dioxygenase
MSLSYSEYLKIPGLLDLQQVRSAPAEHDETLFIIIHQTYELWFKQILHEFNLLRTALNNGATWQAAKTLRRVLTILKTLVAQVDVLETMTPLSFKSFRSFLERASGFQSVQFREIEILCGYYSPMLDLLMKQDARAQQILENRKKDQTLWEAFCNYLQSCNVDVERPKRVANRGNIYETSQELQARLVNILKTQPEISLVVELMVDLDEGFMEWRYRHLKLVQRTIGIKPGTGGSEGAGYLSKTLQQHFFPDLWQLRSEL